MKVRFFSNILVIMAIFMSPELKGALSESSTITMSSDKIHFCDLCDIFFMRTNHLEKHVRCVHEKKRIQCQKCNSSFYDSKQDRERHEKTKKHLGTNFVPEFFCDRCEMLLGRKDNLKAHQQRAICQQKQRVKDSTFVHQVTRVASVGEISKHAVRQRRLMPKLTVPVSTVEVPGNPINIPKMDIPKNNIVMTGAIFNNVQLSSDGRVIFLDELVK